MAEEAAAVDFDDDLTPVTFEPPTKIEDWRRLPPTERLEGAFKAGAAAWQLALGTRRLIATMRKEGTKNRWALLAITAGFVTVIVAGLIVIGSYKERVDQLVTNSSRLEERIEELYRYQMRRSSSMSAP